MIRRNTRVNLKESIDRTVDRNFEILKSHGL